MIKHALWFLGRAPKQTCLETCRFLMTPIRRLWGFVGLCELRMPVGPGVPGLRGCQMITPGENALQRETCVEGRSWKALCGREHCVFPHRSGGRERAGRKEQHKHPAQPPRVCFLPQPFILCQIHPLGKENTSQGSRRGTLFLLL